MKLGLAIFAAAVIAAAATVPLEWVRPPVPRDDPVAAWSDLQNRCRYIVVDLSADGLEIAITGDGADVCARRINVNGVRAIPERRI